MLVTDKVGGLGQLKPDASKLQKPAEKGGPSFEDALKQIRDLNTHGPQQKQLVPQLKFSNHAVERMRLRGLSFSKPQLDNIANAVEKARAKGAKDTLVLNEDSALIVSVKNNTVVTIMDRANMKDNVFTNIDSTVFA